MPIGLAVLGEPKRSPKQCFGQRRGLLSSLFPRDVSSTYKTIRKRIDAWVQKINTDLKKSFVANKMNERPEPAESLIDLSQIRAHRRKRSIYVSDYRRSLHKELYCVSESRA